MTDWEQIGLLILDEWKAKREFPEPYASREEEKYWEQREELRQILEDAVHTALVKGDGRPLAICIEHDKLFPRSQIAASLTIASWHNLSKRRAGVRATGQCS